MTSANTNLIGAYKGDGKMVMYDRLLEGTYPKTICIKKFTSLDVIESLFDGISQHAGFYYGRYDLKCYSIEELRQGKNFSILEFNGCGAEPQHVNHSGLTLWQGNKEFFKHWQPIFRITKYKRKRGIKPWKFKKGREFLRQE